MRYMLLMGTAEDTTRVRLEGGRHLVIDGPFVETKEVLDGFYVIECPPRATPIALRSLSPAR